MSDPLLGSIILFAGNFAPRGYALCEGQTLPIAQNTALFSLLGTTYGGNGTTTFALPDLRGRAPIGPGQGPGLASYVLGEQAGVETVTLSTSQLPAHNHPLQSSSGEQTTDRPTSGGGLARGGAYISSGDASDVSIGPTAGGNQPHENRPPYLALNYIIALQGIFPSRN
jgi:microcystin-dependent protein